MSYFAPTFVEVVCTGNSTQLGLSTVSSPVDYYDVLLPFDFISKIKAWKGEIISQRITNSNVLSNMLNGGTITIYDYDLADYVDLDAWTDAIVDVYETPGSTDRLMNQTNGFRLPDTDIQKYCKFDAADGIKIRIKNATSTRDTLNIRDTFIKIHFYLL